MRGVVSLYQDNLFHISNKEHQIIIDLVKKLTIF